MEVEGDGDTAATIKAIAVTVMVQCNFGNEHSVAMTCFLGQLREGVSLLAIPVQVEKSKVDLNAVEGNTQIQARFQKMGGK